MISVKRFLPIFVSLLVSFAYTAIGQQVPFFPVSYRIFDPYIFNPAIAGSKDYSSADLIGSWNGNLNSQILCANSRLLKKGSSYFASPDFKEFSSMGVGGYVFREINDSTRNFGFSAGFSYQIPLSYKDLSFFSFGIALKGIRNYEDSVSLTDPSVRKTMKTTTRPNMDVGIYYFGPKIYAGISATNILGNGKDTVGISTSQIPVFFTAGYKFIISRSLNIVLEPSLIMNVNRTALQKEVNLVDPMLKIYVQNFCLGTYFNNYDNISLFFLAKYPRLYVGTYFEIPRNSPFYKKNFDIEAVIGINFSRVKPSYHKYYHW
jgi:type IX secretion system PorP/SprF family membrane protein